MNARALTIIAFCVTGAALYFAQDVLIPLALSVMLTFLLAPLANRLEDHRVPRIPAVLIVVMLAFGLIGVMAYTVTGQLYELAQNLPEYKDNIKRKIEFLKPTGGGVIEQFTRVAEEMRETVATTQPATSQPTTQPDITGNNPGMVDRMMLLTPEGLHRVMSSSLRDGPPIPVTIREETSTLAIIGSSATVILEPLASVGIVIVLVIFMLLEREQLRDRLIHLLGSGNVNVTTRALDDAASRISKYLLAQAIVNGTYGIAVSIGLWLIGLTLGGDQGFPNYALWGLLCAVLRFIPYVGPWIGAILPITLSVILFDNFRVFGATVSMFVIIELLSNNLMEPWLYGSSTGMSTVAVLMAAIFWTWIWGPIGLMLATPLTACIVVVGKYVPQLKFLNVLLGDEPVFDPPTRVYQRLLARDRGEAHDLVEEFLETMPLEQVYDEILVPALETCEMDRDSGQLDDARADFVISEIGVIVNEIGEKHCELARASADNNLVLRQGRPRITGDPPIHVRCLPSHDEADEVIGAMLTQLLRYAGYEASNGSYKKLATERIQAVAEAGADIVVISALPPSASVHIKYMLKRLATQFTNLRTIVGFWTRNEDLSGSRRRLERDPSLKLAATLGEALEEIHEFAQLLILDKGSNKPKA